MNAILGALQTLLGNAAALSYVEAVSVRKWRSDWRGLPDFDKWGIVLSPKAMGREAVSVGLVQYTARIDVVCLVRDYHAANSLTGTATGAKGLLQLVEDVRGAVEADDLAGTCEVLGDELAGEINIEEIASPERDLFYHEAKLPYRFRARASVLGA